jgi:hypothetical protein
MQIIITGYFHGLGPAASSTATRLNPYGVRIAHRLQYLARLAASRDFAVSHSTVGISPCSPHRTTARHLVSFAHTTEASLPYVLFLDHLNYMPKNKLNMLIQNIKIISNIAFGHHGHHLELLYSRLPLYFVARSTRHGRNN